MKQQNIKLQKYKVTSKAILPYGFVITFRLFEYYELGYIGITDYIS